MTSTRFDPVRFKETLRANWNAMSGGWLSYQDIFERGGAPVSRRLLELAEVRPGHRVLDVGTGIGEPALTAADVVGPDGAVTGVDLAPEMVAVARRRAAGRPNVDFLVGDAESLDLPAGSFDVVLSRWGLMFAVDHVAAFRAVAGVLVPGGRLAASVWGPPRTAPMMSRGFQALAQRLDLPAPPEGEPSPYSMSDPQRLRADVAAAGFTGVSVTEFVVPFRMRTTDEYLDFYRICSPPGLLAMVEKKFGSKDDPATWAAVAEAIAPYREDDGGYSLPSTALLISAVKPA